MRIWDVHPGYLDRKRLLGEHRELHGLFNVISLGKRGYARHPETLRWVDCLPALRQRHGMLVREMELRGYNHRSPLAGVEGVIDWPEGFVDEPCVQFALLAAKQVASIDPKDRARIPLPRNAQEFWAQHKYQVMAHAPSACKQFGREVATGIYADNLGLLARDVTVLLRCTLPTPGQRYNALLHMWGYLDGAKKPPEDESLMISMLQKAVLEKGIAYLLHSTALAGFPVAD